MTPKLDLRNRNTLWSGVLVETLARSGVTHAVISPGSRSTPLAFAFAAHEGIEAIPVLDERSAAFFALGLAKASGRPAVLVCTSGSAAANYFPAIVEAHESAVPLVVLTADRPPEMRACASGQTIDQQKLYGGYVNFHHELAVPAARIGLLDYLRQTVAHAVQRALAPAAGPVHLNVPFRDPLPPVADDGATAKAVAKVDWEEFFAQVAPPAPVTVATPLPALHPDVHGVIVIGPNQPAESEEFVAAAGEIARRLGWPVLADGLSPVRNAADAIPHVVTAYDAILRDPPTAARLKPEVVLSIGGWPTSKVLRTWLGASVAPIWLVTDRPDNRDALHGRTRQIAISLPLLAAGLAAGADANGYEQMWARYEHRAVAVRDRALEATTELFEPKAAWLLGRHLPAGTPLFIANSMPIRDVEFVWPAGDRGIRSWCNRGANGIDGTLSTALGVAHASGRPTVLLTGDLALLHDTNGFLLRARLRASLTIVLINNRGGGIFEHLPVAHFDPPFEEFFATPQDVDFARLAATYGVEHVLVHDWAQFTALVATLPAAGIRVLELRTDRKRDARARGELFNAMAAES